MQVQLPHIGTAYKWSGDAYELHNVWVWSFATSESLQVHKDWHCSSPSICRPGWQMPVGLPGTQLEEEDINLDYVHTASKGYEKESVMMSGPT